ncbi:MAG: hypothetical protein ACXVAX_08420 [Pseudobdellovibrio sp.]
MKLLTLSFLLLTANKSYSSIDIIGEKVQSYKTDISTCAVNDICDLKEFRFVEWKKKVILPKEDESKAFYETDTRAVLETSSVDKIEKYAIVQMIKGCQYESLWDGKTLTQNLTIMRNHMGNTVVFKHKTWQVDNDHPAPIYTGVQFDDGHIDPFYLLNWNDDPKSLDADNSKFYGSVKPTHPVVFATDLPGPGAFRAQTGLQGVIGADNTSLEYRTCLFKTADLPKLTDGDGTNIDFSKVIKCFSWDHKFIYDFKAGKFKSPAAIEDICLN